MIIIVNFASASTSAQPRIENQKDELPFGGLSRWRGNMLVLLLLPSPAVVGSLGSTSTRFRPAIQYSAAALSFVHPSPLHERTPLHFATALRSLILYTFRACLSDSHIPSRKGETHIGPVSSRSSSHMLCPRCLWAQPDRPEPTPRRRSNVRHIILRSLRSVARAGLPFMAAPAALLSPTFARPQIIASAPLIPIIDGTGSQ